MGREFGVGSYSPPLLDVFLVLIVADDASPLCMDVVEVMVVRMVQFVNQR